MFQNCRVPCADELNLYSLSFDDFSLNEDEMLLASVTMFIELGLVSKFNIDRKVGVCCILYKISFSLDPHRVAILLIFNRIYVTGSLSILTNGET